MEPIRDLAWILEEAMELPMGSDMVSFTEPCIDGFQALHVVDSGQVFTYIGCGRVASSGCNVYCQKASGPCRALFPQSTADEVFHEGACSRFRHFYKFQVILADDAGDQLIAWVDSKFASILLGEDHRLVASDFLALDSPARQAVFQKKVGINLFWKLEFSKPFNAPQTWCIIGFNRSGFVLSPRTPSSFDVSSFFMGDEVGTFMITPSSSSGSIGNSPTSPSAAFGDNKMEEEIQAGVVEGSGTMFPVVGDSEILGTTPPPEVSRNVDEIFFAFDAKVAKLELAMQELVRANEAIRKFYSRR